MIQRLILGAVLLTLTGCMGAPGPLDLTKSVVPLADAATDRIGAWVQVRQAETGVAKEIAAARIAEAKARSDEALHGGGVVLTINDSQSMAIYQLGLANKQLANTANMLGDVLATVVTGKSTRGGGQYTPFPEGAFSEGFRAFFGGIKGVLETTPASLIGGGWALDKVFNNRPAGNVFNGDVKADNSFNTSTLHQTGSTGNPSMAPAIVRPEVVRPEVVDPVIVEQPEPIIVNSGAE